MSEFYFIGKGIYSVPEASRFVRVPPARIRRWIRGYCFNVGDERHESEPVLASYFEAAGSSALSFLDMIELRFVNAFRSAGVSWPTIRLASERARQMVGHDHPFSTNRFKTDGRSILAEVGTEKKDRALLNMVSQQFTIRKLVLPYLYKGLDFSKDDFPVRWWPAGNKTILIDPHRSFGQPIVAKTGVPTYILAQAYRIEKSFERIAAWYEVDRRSVKAAVEFEASLAA